MFLNSDFIERSWPISNTQNFQILQQFDAREVGAFKADEGSFVYKILDTSLSYKDAQSQTFIFDFLKKAGFDHAPGLIKTKSGTSFEKIKDRFVIILEKINGQHAEPTPENYAQLGSIMGELHRIKDYTHKAPISISAIRPDFPDLARKLPEFMQEDYCALAQALPDLDDLPKSLIHFEMNLQANALQRDDGRIVVLDWDEAGLGTSILDPGYLLISQFVSEDCVFEKECAAAFFKSYRSEYNLSDLEINRLFDAALFHALRYIIWGNVEKRWNRIQWALANKEALMSVI